LIKNVEDNAAVAIALIENIQREDLNAIEEAVALQRLMTEFELSHQQVAEAVGKSRSAVSNLLRLNQLNDDVKQLVEHGDLDMGHARALLSLDGELQSDTARTVAQKGLTVRDTERMVQKLLNPPTAKPEIPVDQQSVAWSETLSEKLGVSVQFVRAGEDNGKIVLSYQSCAEFEKIRHFFNLN
jgi:ParB family chromosome partitioning protein